MRVAGAMLVVLVLSLLAPGTTPCLRCWPDAVLYVPYDLRLLLGAAQPGGAAGLEKELSALFLGGPRDRRIQVMERESLEREAGKLFYHLDQIITRNRHDPRHLMKEAQLEKQNFTKRLRAASAAILQKVCDRTCGGRSQHFSLAKCSNCQHLQARCRDRQVCSGAATILAVVLSLGLVLGAGAAVGRRARGAETKEGLTTDGMEPPMDPRDGTLADQEDWSPPPADQGDRPPIDQEDWPPLPVDQGNRPSLDQDWPPPPMDQVNRPPVDHGDQPPYPMDQEDWPLPPPPADQGDWPPPPADQGNWPPVDQDDWPPAPTDQEYRAPAEGQPLTTRE